MNYKTRNLLTFEYEKKEAKKLTLVMKGDVQEYALNLLNLFNHKREYPSTFYNLENNAGNKVFITFNPDHEESVIDFVENFGTIERVVSVRLYDVIARYDFDDFDKVFDRDDTEILIDFE